MNAPLDSFESALLERLCEHVDEQPATRPGRSRPRLLLGAAAVVAAAAAIVVVVPGLGTTTAYSVQEGNSGTITVEVRRLEDAQGLEADLAKHGIDAEVTYLPDRQQCAPGRYTPVDRRLSGMEVSMGSHLLRVTLPPGAVRTGETFVMAMSGGPTSPPSSEPSQDGITNEGGFAGWTDFDVTAGPVGRCVVVPG
ncbi:hypothetical protein GCM10009795_007530 [Nocardioides hankookensis]|uniref:PASTA domain-containing protein n=1 Tax=Nocardioides hankookensis TaxID=443157 RepID=A0ABW1LHU5_9ACTN